VKNKETTENSNSEPGNNRDVQQPYSINNTNLMNRKNPNLVQNNSMSNNIFSDINGVALVSSNEQNNNRRINSNNHSSTQAQPLAKFTKVNNRSAYNGQNQFPRSNTTICIPPNNLHTNTQLEQSKENYFINSNNNDNEKKNSNNREEKNIISYNKPSHSINKSYKDLVSLNNQNFISNNTTLHQVITQLYTNSLLTLHATTTKLLSLHKIKVTSAT